MKNERTYKKEIIAPQKVLREVLRNYLTFRDLVGGYGSPGRTGADGRKDTIEHSYLYLDEKGEEKKATIEISFWDLQDALKELAPRKREAVFYNVIMDMKQADVAKKMGITTVSVGQYALGAMEQLCQKYFTPEELKGMGNE